MLVLTRKVGETIVLPGLDVQVTVLEVRRGRVRVGIQAPPHIEVQRQELLERKEGERTLALASRRRHSVDNDFAAAASESGVAVAAGAF